LPPHQCLVDLDGPPAPDAIAIGPDHPSPQLVQDLESGLVPLYPELPPELEGGLARGWVATR